MIIKINNFLIVQFSVLEWVVIDSDNIHSGLKFYPSKTRAIQQVNQIILNSIIS